MKIKGSSISGLVAALKSQLNACTLAKMLVTKYLRAI